MGNRKKDRGKQRKMNKQAVATQMEHVKKALALTPSGMEELISPTFFLQQQQQSSQLKEQEEQQHEGNDSNPTNTIIDETVTDNEQTEEDGDKGAGAGTPIAAILPTTATDRQTHLVYHTRTSLPPAWKGPIFGIFKKNMEDQYKQNWGYREGEKQAEIFHQDSRYLVAVQTTTTEAAVTFKHKDEKEKDGMQGTEEEAAASATTVTTTTSKPVGFVHLRFVLDEDEDSPAAVLYVYEIQLTSAVQRQGLGAKMMAAIEEMAAQTQMKKLKLTVFKTNAVALDFYQKKLDYVVDATSPSKWNMKTECYEILSKEVPIAASAAVAEGKEEGKK